MNPCSEGPTRPATTCVHNEEIREGESARTLLVSNGQRRWQTFIGNTEPNIPMPQQTSSANIPGYSMSATPKYFLVYGHDNGSYAFRDSPRPANYQKIQQSVVPDFSGADHTARRCNVCGNLVSKWEEPLLRFIVNERRYDIGSTYDGVVIVSGRFIQVYLKQKLMGLVFTQLPDDSHFFSIQAKRCVAYDSDRRKTRFMSFCEACGQFDTVVGATPAYFRPGTIVEDREFVRSDLEFGSGDEKGPLLVCGELAARALRDARLRGLELLPVASS